MRTSFDGLRRPAVHVHAAAAHGLRGKRARLGQARGPEPLVDADRGRRLGHQRLCSHAVTVLELETPHGPARAHLQPVDEPLGALMLGHGAGGGVQARDITTAASAANANGFSVALIEQPYRVAGRRSPAPASQLDAAWIAIAEQLSERAAPEPAAHHGRAFRGSKSRVPNRPRRPTRWACSASPSRSTLHSARTRPPSARAGIDELDMVHVPALVVQGVNDRFGMPPATHNRIVAQIKGDHRLQSDLSAIATAVDAWLPQVLRAWAATRA